MDLQSNPNVASVLVHHSLWNHIKGGVKSMCCKYIAPVNLNKHTCIPFHGRCVWVWHLC